MALTKVLNVLTSLIGWSPVGKTVLVTIDDASDPTLNGRQFVGKLVTLNNDGTAVIEPDTLFTLRGNIIRHMLAVPRHEGYDFFYLRWGFIAVNLFACDGVYRLGTTQTESWFGIASLKIIKSRKTGTV
jgi:hypothetical protein